MFVQLQKWPVVQLIYHIVDLGYHILWLLENNPIFRLQHFGTDTKSPCSILRILWLICTPTSRQTLLSRRRMESRPFSEPSPLLPCNRCPIWLFASKLAPKLDPLAIVFTNGGKEVRCCLLSFGNLLSGDQCLTERSSPVLKLVSVSCWRRTLSCPCPALSLWEQNSLAALSHFEILHTSSLIINRMSWIGYKFSVAFEFNNNRELGMHAVT